MIHALVDSLDKVIDNIARYKIEVGREPRLAGQMKMVRAWYADRVNDGKWFFGPSKFVGYASSTAKAYLSKIDKRDTYRSRGGSQGMVRHRSTRVHGLQVVWLRVGNNLTDIAPRPSCRITLR